MNLVTEVIISFQIEGFHNWPAAAEYDKEVAFLADRHRHIFHFRLWKPVTHSDRDIEIILFKREVIKWLIDIYGKRHAWGGLITATAPLEFGAMSCEQIAENLLTAFACSRVEVLEDGENGAIVWTE